MVLGYWSQKIQTLTYPSSQLGDGSLYLPNVIFPLLQYVAQRNQHNNYTINVIKKPRQPGPLVNSKQLINLSCFTTHINKVQSLKPGNDIAVVPPQERKWREVGISPHKVTLDHKVCCYSTYMYLTFTYKIRHKTPILCWLFCRNYMYLITFSSHFIVQFL